MTEPLFRDYGGAGSFCGPIATVRVFEDNVLVRETLETEGGGEYWSWTVEDPRGVP